MRISEKTIEINFCAAVTARLWPWYKIIWFGLTQKQEAHFGFDTCTKLNAKMFIFQFKASNHLLKNGQRRFDAQHDQMARLKKLAEKNKRSVFYVFPNFGNTLEFSKVNDVLSECYLSDISQFPDPVPPPIGKNGQVRKSNNHYVKVDIGNKKATYHSDPFDAEIFAATEIFGHAPIIDYPGPWREYDGRFIALLANSIGPNQLSESGISNERLEAVSDLIGIPGLYAAGFVRNNNGY